MDYEVQIIGPYTRQVVKDGIVRFIITDNTNGSWSEEKWSEIIRDCMAVPTEDPAE